MIRMWMRGCAQFDQFIGIRCPILWAWSREYRAEIRRLRGRR
jgi:hypothetical protein